jgi:hypothetical protein
MQPGDLSQFEAARVRLARGGWKRVSASEWRRQAFAVAPAGAIDVVGGDFVRITTGAASFYAGLEDTRRVTPMWRSAAVERRAFAGLVLPGRFDDEFGMDLAGRHDVLELAASQQGLWGALVPVRFDAPGAPSGPPR